MSLAPLDLGASALVVWDMQRGIAGRAYNGAEIVPRIRELLVAYRARGLPVVYSQHTMPPPAWGNPAMARAWARRGIPAGGLRLTPGSPDWTILPELAPEPEELVLPKTTPSFFVGTPLEAMLRFRGIATLVLTGVSAEAGILGTARHAIDLGFLPLVVEDAVGSMSPDGRAQGLATLRALCDVEPAASVVARLPPR
ncbi:MAG TPA: isochorismatase family cysteine hydrolase [Thermoplasmata archaeon]|nr:isochorismatase family cysteine hydrolase [Thermoplasmata archaeon]